MNADVKALTKKKQDADSLEKAKRQSLEDKLKHAKEAAKLLKAIGNSKASKTPKGQRFGQTRALENRKNRK